MFLAKLDGTARGGIVLAIRNELHLPILFIGTGEQVQDIAPFDAREFVGGPAGTRARLENDGKNDLQLATAP